MEQTSARKTISQLASTGYVVITDAKEGVQLKIIAHDMILKQDFLSEGIAIRHVLLLQRMFSGGKVLVFLNTSEMREAFYLLSHPEGFMNKLPFDISTVSDFDWQQIK
jgi:2-succinyl-5-enolpyruvyl-6-hydroxy-3-cyclohexene-1-carboxylate synthase